MARSGRPMNGFMHINGVTYELGPQKDASAISQLAMRLKAPQGTQHQIVILKGQRVELTIDLASVWASATWIEPRGSRRRSASPLTAESRATSGTISRFALRRCSGRALSGRCSRCDPIAPAPRPWVAAGRCRRRRGPGVGPRRSAAGFPRRAARRPSGRSDGADRGRPGGRAEHHPGRHGRLPAAARSEASTMNRSVVVLHKRGLLYGLEVWRLDGSLSSATPGTPRTRPRCRRTSGRARPQSPCSCSPATVRSRARTRSRSSSPTTSTGTGRPTRFVEVVLPSVRAEVKQDVLKLYGALGLATFSSAPPSCRRTAGRGAGRRRRCGTP